MVEKDHPRLSVAVQCRLLSIPRPTFYHRPAGETVENLALMQVIDRQFMGTPFFGVRQMTWHLRNEGHAVNPKRVRRLTRLMGLIPIYRKPNTSRPAKGRQPYPYLLRGLTIDRPNQVWCADITYLPMRRGFLYLVAIMDWHSRRVLSWRLSNTLEAEFCANALAEAIARFGSPEIMNTDQGSQFTAFVWTDLLRKQGGHPHLDGRQGSLPRQHLHRTALAQPQIRMRLPARLGDRIKSPRRAAKLVRRLQPPAASRCPRRTTAGRGLPRRHDDHATRPRDPESSLENGRPCPRIGEHFTHHAVGDRNTR